MINTVKLQGSGYLVNGVTWVPSDLDNRHYREVEEFINNGGIVEEEFTAEQITAREILEVNAEAREYLTTTDWYVIRFTETGIEVPADVSTQRTTARLSIV